MLREVSACETALCKEHCCEGTVMHKLIHPFQLHTSIFEIVLLQADYCVL